MSLTANREYELKTIFAFLKAKKDAMSLIAVFSVLGIALGVAVLVTVMSVMNGFQSEIKNRMLGVIPHASIIGSQDRIQNWGALQTVLIDSKEIKSFSTFASSEALILSSKDLAGIQIKGIDPEENGLSDKLNNIMTYGKVSTLSAGGFNIVIGNRLATDLGLSIDDSVTVVISNTIISVIGSTPRLKKFNVSGIFNAGIQEFDQNIAFINLNTLESFFNLEKKDRNLEIYLKNPSNIETIKLKIQEIFNNEFVYTWSDMNSSLFSALKVERNVMFIILSLIIIVAAFNIISGLTILVKNKTREIAILKSIGVLNKSITKIFFLVGTIIGTSATLFGVFLGVMFSLYIENLRVFLSNVFNISLFPEEIYFLSTMPSEINPSSIFVISICSIIITILVSIFPAIKASKLDPVKALKYE